MISSGYNPVRPKSWLPKHLMITWEIICYIAESSHWAPHSYIILHDKGKRFRLWLLFCYWSLKNDAVAVVFIEGYGFMVIIIVYKCFAISSQIWTYHATDFSIFQRIVFGFLSNSFNLLHFMWFWNKKEERMRNMNPLNSFTWNQILTNYDFNSIPVVILFSFVMILIWRRISNACFE